jgi:hypothetical protein
MTDAYIQNLELKLQEAGRAKSEAIGAFLAAESRLVAALIQHGEEQYENKGIVYGCRVTATSTNCQYSWTGIYVGHQKAYGSFAYPVVMKETEYGRPHKSDRISSGCLDWRLADD